MNNNDERDYAEEADNRRLMTEERDPPTPLTPAQFQAFLATLLRNEEAVECALSDVLFPRHREVEPEHYVEQVITYAEEFGRLDQAGLVVSMGDASRYVLPINSR